MKRISSLIFIVLMAIVALAQVPELTVEQNLEDYDYAVKYLEDNYAGFPNKVVDSTRADYESMKARLRTQVEQGERTGWDAVAQYTAWFDDFHTRLNYSARNEKGNWESYGDRYRSRKPIDYNAFMEEYRPKAVACKVTDKTFLIRFPSCDGNPDMEWIKGSIMDFKESGCENLVLDIRDNGGGSDVYFNPYWELLYDHEGTEPAVEYRNSPEHRKMLLKEFQDSGVPQEFIMGIQAIFPMIEGIEYLPQPLLRQILPMFSDSQNVSMQDLMGVLGKLNQSGGDFSVDTYRLNEISDDVRKAALIIDNGVASSGEQMVRSIKATSDRTTVYGRDNTLGCLDFSNINVVEMPNCHLSFSSPMTRTIGLPDGGIDATGIAPDILIPLPLPARLTDNIDEWVIWVAEQLEK